MSSHTTTVGVSVFLTDYSIGVTDLVRAAEDRGIATVWFPEHSHIPVHSRHPGSPDGKQPEKYLHVLDPIVALAAAATVTTRIRLATGVVLVSQRDPILLAKEIATLDHISAGRCALGIGAGWNVEEMANHGTDPQRRWSLVRERVLAMREIWTHDEAEFHGRYVDFDPIWQWPKPVSSPHPPIYLGGDSPGTAKRLVEYADGWLAHVGLTPPAELEGRMADLGRLAAEAGRAAPVVAAFGIEPDRAAEAASIAATGVEECIFALPSVGYADAIACLDHIVSGARAWSASLEAN